MLEKSFICGNSVTLKTRWWLVRVIERGDTYGRENCLTHVKLDPLVEFHDLNRGVEKPQFVSRYYLSTLRESRWGMDRSTGINLYGSVVEWAIDGPSLDTILAWLTGDQDGDQDHDKP